MNTAALTSPSVQETGNLQIIKDVPLRLRAELDRCTISLRQLLGLDLGSVLSLTRPTGENIDIYAGEVLVASGEVLVIDSMLAVRIASLRYKSNALGDHETPSPKAVRDT